METIEDILYKEHRHWIDLVPSIIISGYSYLTLGMLVYNIDIIEGIYLVLLIGVLALGCAMPFTIKLLAWRQETFIVTEIQFTRHYLTPLGKETEILDFYGATAIQSPYWIVGLDAGYLVIERFGERHYTPLLPRPNKLQRLLSQRRWQY